MTNFNSVSTSAARIQDISLNPQKLAGQCGKLKCCMNFELDSYQDAIKDFPSKEIQLETVDNIYYHFKTDVFKGLLAYSTSQNFAANLITISAKRAKEIIAMNRKGSKPEFLDDHSEEIAKPIVVDYENGVGEGSLTRFDSNKKLSNNTKNRRPDHRPQQTRPDQNDNKGGAPRFQKPIKKSDSGNENNEKLYSPYSKLL